MRTGGDGREGSDKKFHNICNTIRRENKDG